MSTNILKTKENEIFNLNKKIIRMYKPIASKLEIPNADEKKLNYIHD